MRWSWIALSVCCACAVAPEADPPGISGGAIAAHTRFLSHDLLEGRGVGGRGEGLTVEYLAAQLAVAGALPAGDDGTYFQKVPLVEQSVQPGSVLRLDGRELSPGEDYVLSNQRQTAQEIVDAEIVYVGHGIAAPEFDWDDFKSVDVRGKVVLLFTNEPPSEDDSFFGGRALTYYGRWTFKYEEAARRGALGALIVHTDDTAGYPWEVVRNSWSGGQLAVENQPGEPKLALAGWLSEASARHLLAASDATRGSSLDELLDRSNQRSFRPVPLGLRAQADIRSSIVPVATANVLGRFEGSDLQRKPEAVLYTAHWDHLGVASGTGGEDAIYNGAVDNATGCAALLEIARAYGRLAEAPRRTILFAFVGAEESGLLGSDFYAANPAIPMGRTAVNLNYDGLFPFGETEDFSLPGHERTTLKPTVDALAAEFDVALTPDARPEQGYYYRSDQFSLAKRGVPAFSLKIGERFVGKPPEWGADHVAAYIQRSYHKPSDEYSPEWDFAGLAKLARFGFELGRRVANQDAMPTWQEGDEFLAARERSME